MRWFDDRAHGSRLPFLSRFCEASHMAGASVCKPDCQPVLRLPLHVQQLEMSVDRAAAAAAPYRASVPLAP